MTTQATQNLTTAQNSIHYYGFLLLGLSMPLPFYPISNISIVVLAVNALAGMFIRKEFITRKNMLLVVLPSALFVLYVIGVSYSSNTSAAWSSVERKVPLLLLPIAAAFFPKLEIKKLNNIFLAFLASCIVISILCVVSMLKRNIDAGIEFAYYNNFYFAQDNLVLGVGFHHVYFSMYMCFCVVICIYFMHVYQKLSVRIILGVMIAWSILFMLALSARMGIVALMIILGLYFLVMLKAKWPVKLTVGAVALLILTTVGYQFPFIREKFTGLLNVDVNDYSSRYQVSTRMVSIASTWQIFKENWVAGVGTGDLDEMLIEEYKRINFIEGLENTYNPHNQYVDTAGTIGIAGALMLAGSMFLMLYYAVRNRDFVALAYAVIVSFCFLSESMLARQRGAVFLATFMSLIFVYRGPENEPILKFRI
jgi:O-antigen ligase